MPFAEPPHLRLEYVHTCPALHMPKQLLSVKQLALLRHRDGPPPACIGDGGGGDGTSCVGGAGGTDGSGPAAGNQRSAPPPTQLLPDMQLVVMVNVHAVEVLGVKLVSHGWLAYMPLFALGQLR